MDNRWSQVGLSAVVTGTVATLVSTAALAALAKMEGKGALQPTNATSHWLNGDEAANVELPDAGHTAVGFLTHHASAILWAAPFEAWLAANPPRSLGVLLRDAFAMSGIAFVVDYGLTPHRFTPGWELVLSKRSMFASYVALAFGLASGALVSERLRDSMRQTWLEAIPERFARLTQG
ncbi:MAG: hypothetical protein CTY15_02425 [Methylocystis sp.]|nr:MAG: hypothetical protein CTY15_02425 [Methylocystis sp.]